MTFRPSEKTVAVCVMAMTSVLMPALASAQTSASSPSPRIGDIVWVTSAGRTTKGRLWTISADSIVVDAGKPVRFRRAEIQQLERQVPDSSRDGIWKGAILGAGIGALAGLFGGAAESSSSAPDNPFGGVAGGPFTAAAGGAVLGAVLGMPTGLLIDALHHGRESVSVTSLGSARLGVRPIMSPTRVGSQFTINW